MKTTLLLIIVSLFVSAAQSALLPVEEAFRKADTAKPWAYWWWLNGNVDESTITRDLEAMKAAGFGGLLQFDARGYHDDKSHVPAPPSRMDFMSTEWRR